MLPNVLAQIEITGLVAWIALAFPLCLLATMIGLALRGRKATRVAIAERGCSADVTTGQGASSCELVADVKEGSGFLSLIGSSTPHLPPDQIGLEAYVAVLSRDGGAAVVAALQEAENTKEAANALRGIVLQSAKTGAQDVEAAARLQLGDMAEEESDMTTACEHWQIARDLFHATDNPAARDIAEEKMQRNGCPTDWVLNDF